jgi:hypothetical protein
VNQARITEANNLRVFWMRVDSLYSQARAALGATCIDNVTACLGFHAGTETVGALAADGRGLVSAFHRGSFQAITGRP